MGCNRGMFLSFMRDFHLILSDPTACAVGCILSPLRGFILCCSVDQEFSKVLIAPLEHRTQRAAKPSHVLYWPT
jgi:hypothetical protein